MKPNGDGTIEWCGKLLCVKCGRHLCIHEVAHGQCRGCGAGLGRPNPSLGRRA
jgi:hypothetical protein